MENTSNLPAVLESTTEAAVFSVGGFDFYQRIAKTLSASDVVPAIYKGGTPKALANCLIAIELSVRMKESVFFVMQNLDIIHGRPAWRSQFKTAQVNSSGRFRPLRYEWETKPGSKIKYSEWVNDGQKPDGSPKRKKVDKEFVLKENLCCRAVTTDKEGNKYDGPWISYELAVVEGWWHRDGSKWATMGDKMLMYRAASWFVDVYDPGASMGLKTVEEVQDAQWEEIESTPTPRRSRVDDLNDGAPAGGGVADDDENGENPDDSMV